MELPIKIGFDIGGVLSKYPEIFRALIRKLSNPEPAGLPNSFEIHVISDMHDVKAMYKMLLTNNIIINENNIHSADYKTYGEYCKTKLCKDLGINIMIDDFIGYLAEGDFVRLLVMPDPKKPYYNDSWLTDGSEGDFGRRKKPENI